MAADTGAALVDARLFGRPRAYGGNSQEWNAFKFVFKSYIVVVAHPMLAAMIHAETLRESIMLSLSKRRTATRSSSAGHCPVPVEIGWVKGKGQGKGKNKENGKGKGKSRGKGKEKTKSEKFEG